MKKDIKKIVLLTLILSVVFSLFAATAKAAEWNDTLYRFNDFCDFLSEADAEEIEDKAYNSVEKYKFDFPIAVVSLKDGENRGEYCDNYYEVNNFGYGANKDGILFVYDMNSGYYVVAKYGKAMEIFTADITEKILDAIDEKWSSEGFKAAVIRYLDIVFAVLDGKNIDTILAEDKPVLPQQTVSPNGSSATVGGIKDRWWETDPKTFVDFHGTNLPHVVDNANMFSASEEAKMSAMIEEIIKKTGYDFVIFTDTTTHGYSARLYADDFYVYNGYGIDDDFSGMVLFIDMDPSDRQWTSEATGKVQPLLTENVVNVIDDSIYSDMVDGYYANAMYTYISKVEELYTTGTVAGAEVGWMGPIIFSAFIGLIVASARLSSMKKKMKSVKKATLANDNIVKDSFNLRNKNVIYLYKNVTRVRISSSSSGRSSYSGSHHSSSGRSFSGGGRHF